MIDIDDTDRTVLHHDPLCFSADSAGFDVNQSAPLILCLHGFPDNPRSYRHQLPALAAAGYRVIAPTLRGYEPSSQPDHDDYDLLALAGDVLAWLDQLGEQKVHLVGHDWGAAIAYVAAARAPERFHSLTTLAAPFPPRTFSVLTKVPTQVLKSWYMFFFQLRGLAEHSIARDDWALIRKLWQSWSPNFDMPDEQWSDLRATFEAPGVKSAMLAYYRQNMSPTIIAGIQKTEALKPTTVPVRTLAITGAEDGCLDTRLHDLTITDRDFPDGWRIRRFAKAGHFVHQEVPEEVNSELIEWFRGW